VPKPLTSSDKKKKIIQSIRWLVAVSWFNRILGFVSIIILARILTPEDFGIMAIVLLSLQFSETLTNIGSEQYFIQKNNATASDLNCAWTSNLIMKLLTSLIFAITTPYIATLYNQQHLIPAFLTIACLPIISALSNGKIYQYKKELNYKKFTSITALSKLLSSIISIALAYILQSYWALIFGAIFHSLLYNIFSYLFIKERTTFGLTNWQEQFQFSKWIILKSFIGHIRAKFDSWFAINIQGISGLGGYNLSKDLVLLPSRELLSPITEIFFTSIAQTENKSSDQQQQIRKSASIIYIIGFPIAFGWGLIAEPFVQVILTDKWLPFVSTISALGFLVVTFSMGNFISQIMTATGHVKQLFYYDVFTLIFALLILTYFLGSIESLHDMALIRVFIGVGIVLIGTICLAFLHIIPIYYFLQSAIFPLLSSILMSQFILSLSLSFQDPKINLGLTIVAAAFIYATFLFIGCKLKAFGRIESTFINGLINDFIKSFRSKI
jgi:O-antigen/teichoic acid export membrane protein